MAASGALLHLVLHPRPAAGVPKEKISDDSPIELEVEPAAQWPLQRAPAAADLLAPLPPNNPLLQPLDCRRCTDMCMSEEERWLAQVEIVTHAGPHRRLWMGPQFVFKTYNTTGSNSSLSEAETVDVEASAARGVARSNPVNMPGVRPIVPVLIDSGSASSLEQSPSDSFRRKSLLAETGRAASVCDVQLKEDLAEAMKEDHGSRRGAAGGAAARSHGVEVCVDPLGTAVRAGGSRAAPPPDGDEYTRDNADEATFRPVVRAPAALPRDMPARPLPRTTTIPVQPLAPRPLPTDVVIPASLSAFLAADARLEREMDDATREPPPRHPTTGSLRLGDVSSSVKVAVELDPPRGAEGSARGTPTRVIEKLERDEPPVEVRARSPRRRTPEPEVASKKAAELELIPEVRRCEVEASHEPERDEVRAVEEKKPDSKPARSARATSESKTSRRELSDQKKEGGSQVKTSSRKESSETKSRLSETKKSSKEVISNAKVTSKELVSDTKISSNEVISNTNISSREVVSDTIISSKEVVSGTKISSKEVIPDTKMLSNEVVLDSKISSKEVVPDTKISSKEIMSDRKSSKVVGSDTKIPAKEVLPDTKVSSKEMSDKKLSKDSDTNISSKEMLSDKKSSKDSDTKISSKEMMPGKKSSKEENSETKILSKNTTSDVTISETKISSKEVIPEMKTLAKRERPEKEKAIKVEISETKSSTKKELTNRKVSSEETEPETKRLPKNQLSDTRPCVKKYLPDANITAAKEVDEMKVSKELPKLKTSVKRDSSFDRESSPRTEQKGFKSAWKKDSTKLEWPAKVEPVETTVPSLKESDCSKTLREQKVVDIRTEEQAWDMLLNEPEKQVLSVSLPPTVADEAKVKSKKNRKIKRTQDDTQNKSEDDSFVEIHAIEENGQPSSGELVSISMPFEEIESSSSYSSKTKKSRSPKNTTDKKEQFNAKLDDWSLEDIDCTIKIKSATRKNSASSELEIVTECDTKTKLRESKTEKVDSQKEESVFVERPLLKEAWKKPKSGITCQENRKSVEKCLEVDVKDVYVIDSTKEEFPEIQITTSRGSKMRKKSPQVDKDKKVDEIEIIPEMPVKSWSSIAASKSLKKPEEDIAKKPENKTIEKKIEDMESDDKNIYIREKKQRASKIQDEEEPISLHEELMRLCKRTDIMVAQCDAPSGLNFVEEHHSLLDDLPPLELDFGLDDFRLEVMRDGLLDVDESTISSPICKINIDSILSSIKESTSAFNLIDLEKVPDKKEKGFSVVEYDKITTQEVKADDDSKSDDKEIEVMEKSSDDDNTSPASADSDKEDKKSTGASNVTLPSSKQLSKSKKSRRKKK